MKVGLFKAWLVSLAALAASCTTPPYCDALQQCGGDLTLGARDFLGTGAPATEWSATTTDACLDQVPNPPSPVSLALIPPRPAGTRAVEPSTIDWCSGIVIQGDGTVRAFDDGWYETLKKYDGWFPGVPLYTASLVLEKSQYSFTASQLVAQHADLSSSCLVAQGVSLTCDQVNTQLQIFVTKKLSSIMGLTARVYDATCAKAAENGCSCDYNVVLTNTVSGPWSQSGAAISFFDSSAAPPAQADFCASGKTLELTGRKGTDLFNRFDLKTLRFQQPTCSDRVLSKSLGETGVDCGGTCPNACPQ
jgi:hypothetical protein